MSSKLPKSALSLKQFMLRQEVLKLYRDIHRTLRHVSDEKTRLDLREWARTDFRKNKHHADQSMIQSLLQHGRQSLSVLQKSIAFSKT